MTLDDVQVTEAPRHREGFFTRRIDYRRRPRKNGSTPYLYQDFLCASASVARTSSAPQDGLSNEVIPNHFFNGRIGIQLLPGLEIRRLVEREPAKQQARLTDRPFIEIHDIRRPGPLLLVRYERHHEGKRLPDAAAIGQLERPQTLVWSRQNLAHHRERVEIEERIPVRFRAPQLLGKAAVRGNLIRHQHRPI